MRPYHIEINWIDFNVTNEDDMYEVLIKDIHNNIVLTRWECTASALGTLISKYMCSEEEIS